MSVHDVLAVDDDPTFLLLLRRRLRGSDVALDTAASADEALARLRAGRVRLLLTDLRMEGVGGIELLGALAAEGLLDGTRACLVSASVPDPAALAEIRALGAELLLKEDVLAPGAVAALLDGQPG